MPAVTKGRGRQAYERSVQTPLLEPDEKPAGYPDIASMLADWRQQAESITVTDAELAAWYAAQCRAAWDATAALFGKVNRNLDRLPDDTTDPTWAKWWRQEATLRVSYRTLELLREKGHILICLSHGVEGAEIPPEMWEPLTHRGILTGEGPNTWLRYCLSCMQDGIDQDAARLALEYAKPIDRERLRKIGYRGKL